MSGDGLTLGSRSNYKYDSDDGKQYTIKMFDALASASGLSAGVGTDGRKPAGVQPRHAWGSATISSKLYRKKIPMSATQRTAKKIGDTLSVDSATFTITGFVGEKDHG